MHLHLMSPPCLTIRQDGRLRNALGGKYICTLVDE
eukprot:CAMPEP_0119340746 /NCGR_PEP_ID=MMETSP1333-20130426/100970_1 /TAXON_ID=418940 /ORGANISM="Scyphosphaera apsteinii, Strain RCC1455" /LENGTH=34 /DNA_ID= /DNA_START= /DNA_END= /DNA_ORIENTATION=